MKVTIEPTEQHDDEYPYSTVTISYPTDDVDCNDAVDMVLNALVAWGFSHSLVFEEREAIIGLQARIKELEELNVRKVSKK